jgi:hypothetical protein
MIIFAFSQANHKLKAGETLENTDDIYGPIYVSG